MKSRFVFSSHRQAAIVAGTHTLQGNRERWCGQAIFPLIGKCLSLFLFLILMSACNREEGAIPDDPGRQGQEVTLRSLSYSGDRLVFSDFEEFRDYYYELDSLFDLDQELFDSIIIATTPVTTIHEEYSTVDGFETFLSDPIMRSVLNLDYEVEIDGALVTYMTDGQILVSDASNNTVRSAIRGLTKGEAVDFGDLPSGAYWAEPKDLEDAIKIGCGCSINIRPHGCDSLRIFGRCNNFFGGNGEGDIWITFDPDGPSGESSVLEDEVDGNYEFYINLTSDLRFQNPGFFFVTVDPSCVLASTVYNEFYYMPDDFASCDDRERSKEEYIQSGNERVFVKTSYYEGFFGSVNRAEIRSETWNGTKWEGTRANLWVEVDANRKNLICDLIDSKDQDKSCGNCMRKSVDVTWVGDIWHCDGDLIGRFRKIKSGVTINHTQEVDFRCCE